MTPTTAAEKVKEIIKSYLDFELPVDDNKFEDSEFTESFNDWMKCASGSRLVGELVEGWISVEDRLPRIGQIVDIWEMPTYHRQETIKSLSGTNYGNQYISDSQYTGWRTSNMKYEQEDAGDDGILNVFSNNKTGAFYHKICIENGEITHWQPLPEPPKP